MVKVLAAATLTDAWILLVCCIVSVLQSLTIYMMCDVGSSAILY